MTFKHDPMRDAFPITYQCLPEVYINVWDRLELQLRMSTTILIQRYDNEERRTTENSRDRHDIR
jgi:hypothetical protein